MMYFLNNAIVFTIIVVICFFTGILKTQEQLLGMINMYIICWVVLVILTAIFSKPVDKDE